jgi:hypothetical protein
MICARLLAAKPDPTSMIMLLSPAFIALAALTVSDWPLVIYSMKGTSFTRIKRSDNPGVPFVICTILVDCGRL